MIVDQGGTLMEIKDRSPSDFLIEQTQQCLNMNNASWPISTCHKN